MHIAAHGNFDALTSFIKSFQYKIEMNKSKGANNTLFFMNAVPPINLF